MGSNHMGDLMKGQKSKDIEINYLNTTRKIISDKERDAKAVMKRVNEIGQENYENSDNKSTGSVTLNGDKWPDNKPAIDKMKEMSFKQPMKSNGYLLTIKELDLPNWCYQNIVRPEKTKSGWGEMTIDVMNVVGENVSEKLSQLLNTSWFSENKLNLKLEMIDPIGNVIESWDYECKLLGYEYSPLSYGDDSLDITKLRLRPKKVKLNS